MPRWARVRSGITLTADPGSTWIRCTFTSAMYPERLIVLHVSQEHIVLSEGNACYRRFLHGDFGHFKGSSTSTRLTWGAYLSASVSALIIAFLFSGDRIKGVKGHTLLCKLVRLPIVRPGRNNPKALLSRAGLSFLLSFGLRIRRFGASRVVVTMEFPTRPGPLTNCMYIGVWWVAPGVGIRSRRLGSFRHFNHFTSLILLFSSITWILLWMSTQAYLVQKRHSKEGMKEGGEAKKAREPFFRSGKEGSAPSGLMTGVFPPRAHLSSFGDPRGLLCPQRRPRRQLFYCIPRITSGLALYNRLTMPMLGLRSLV